MWWRVNLVLLVLTVASALVLVRQAHEGRVLFADLERARAEGNRLAADIHRLNAEREGEATNLRVDQLARQQLNMRPITPALTLQPGAAAPVVLPASAPASSQGGTR